MVGEIPDSKEKDLAAIKFVISDWDGTLVDSLPAYVKCFLMVMEEIGGDPAKLKEYYLASQGSPLAHQLKVAAEQYAGKGLEDTRPLETKFYDFYQQLGNVDVLDGAQDTLKYLKANDFKVVIWSGTRTDILGQMLEQTGLGEYVDFYIGNVPGDDKLVKGPGLFAKIAKHFQISVEQLQKETVVIGDGVADIAAGKNSGARTVGIGSKPERLKEAGADFVVRNIGEVRTMWELPEF